HGGAAFALRLDARCPARARPAQRRPGTRGARRGPHDPEPRGAVSRGRRGVSGLSRGQARLRNARALVRRMDRRLMRRSRLTRSPGLDRALVALTRAASYSRLWLLIAGGLATGGGRKGRIAAERGLIAIAIAATVANGPAKLLVRRGR